ncbi:hypothetical protein AUJ84_03580 [Candidatus Pacearchaeota archaeon CG1_02_32_132]|nr:MAG: hypothetical protein AUJ84_03580 [Candidatus Pacearchaeota archaeon CG1_02_32_132]
MKNGCDVRKLALSLGLTWSLGIFVLGLAAMFWGWGTGVVILLGTLYLGYDSTFLGSIIGAVWAFVDGFVAGWLIAWIYNKI